jgi:hypothetical protein
VVLVGVVDGWDKLADTLNLLHGVVVTTSIFTVGAPPDDRSDNGSWLVWE